jgi:hypothetical protein
MSTRRSRWFYLLAFAVAFDVVALVAFRLGYVQSPAMDVAKQIMGCR